MANKDFENENLPLVSIGMPVYNGERFIRRAIEALQAQTYPRIELVISDNLSNDATWDILLEYANNDPRMSVFRQERNIGAFGNFKYVLSQAKGKYFMWAACDDMWHPDFIGSLVRAHESVPSCCVAMSAVERVDEDANTIDIVSYTGKYNPNTASFFTMMNGVISFKKFNFFIYGLFRKNILDKVINLYHEVPLGDRLFIIHLAMAYKFCYVDKVLHGRTVHSLDSAQRLPEEKFNIMQKELFIDFKLVYLFFVSVLFSPIIKTIKKCYLPLFTLRFAALLALSRASKLKICLSNQFNLTNK